MIPESFIEELRTRSNIGEVVGSYVTLKRAGNRMVGLCPFHNEKTPSFSVSPEAGLFYCFGCGKGGDVITFIRQVENLEYVEAIHLLAKRAGLTVPEDVSTDRTVQQRARILEINREAARYFHQCLMSEPGERALAYLRDRGLSRRTIKRFGLGYSPPGWESLRSHLSAKGFSQEDMLAAAVVSKGRNGGVFDMFRDRVIFPIIDLRGGVIAFGGRLLEGSGPKYLNSPDTLVFKKRNNLFALNFAKSSESDTMILGEGYMDVIAMHQAGFENSVATLGTSLTAEQIGLMCRVAKPRRIAIAYDADQAGQNAAHKAINLTGNNDVHVSVLEMAGAKDPDEYIKKYGHLRFEQLVTGSKNAMDYEIDRLKARYDLAVSEERVSFLNAFCAMMADIQDEMTRDVYIGNVAKQLEVTKERITSTVQAIRKKKAVAVKRRETHNLAVFAQDNADKKAKKMENPSIGGYRAEENMLAVLTTHPDSFAGIRDSLRDEDFFDPDHRQIYHVLTSRIDAGLSLEPIHLSASLTADQMARYSHILEKTRDIKFYPRQADEYSQMIRSQKDAKKMQDKKDGKDFTLEEYDRYITSLSSTKK